MSQDIRTRAKHLYAKVEKYGGWEEVSSARCFAIFEEITGPAALKFAVLKPGRCAREVSGDIIQLFTLERYKGAAYGFRFGVSLRYFPFPYEPILRWHRTLASARFDLFEEPAGYFAAMSLSEANPGAGYFARCMLGETCFREELGRAWDLAGESILAWFDSTRTLDQVLQKCAEQMARQWPGIRHCPDASLIHAFTLARMGRLPEARSGLEKYCNDFSEGPVARWNLDRGLEKIAAA